MWQGDAVDYDLRASHYYIAETTRSCWKCGEETEVFCFLLPQGFEALEDCDPDLAGYGPDDSYTDAEFEAWLASPASKQWMPMEVPATIQYLTAIPPAVLSRLIEHTKHYRPNHSKQAEQTYWMNHCRQCGIRQGDHDLHNEPGGAFFPLEEAGASLIRLYRVDEPFSAKGSYGIGSHMQAMFDCMQKSDVPARAN